MLDLHLFNTKNLCFVLTWMEFGDLTMFYEKDVSLTWACHLSITKDIINGLHYIHEHNILHCDIKPENILFNHKMQAKITDFGLAMVSR